MTGTSKEARPGRLGHIHIVILPWTSRTLARHGSVPTSDWGPLDMGGAHHMAGVAVATPTSQLRHQHFTLLPLLATPNAHQIYTFNVLGHTIFENDSPPMPLDDRDFRCGRTNRGPSSGLDSSDDQDFQVARSDRGPSP